MKASGTAVKARRGGAHGKAPAAKPVAGPAAGAQAKPVPAAAKKSARPVAARAAATAVATKTAPVAKKEAAAEAPATQPQSAPAADAAATAAKPAVAKPAPSPVAPKQPADTKAAAGKTSSPVPPPAQLAPAEPASAQLAPAQPGPEAAPAAASPAPKPSPAASSDASGPAAPAQADAAQSAPPQSAPAQSAPPARADGAAPAQSASRPPGDAARRPGTPGMHTGPITAPRIPAKAEVFQEGDHVVYPTHGVGKVERIATEEIAGHKLELIHITFEENRMTLRVPVAKARTAGLRKLATRKLFEEALSVLKGRARIKRTMWSRRAQEYEAKINSGDPLAIAEVVRDLHRNAGQPDQSFSERQIYEAAMERLAAELAALDKTDKATAATKLSDFLKTV
jgi:CarD family transcriptional regulator